MAEDLVMHEYEVMDAGIVYSEDRDGFFFELTLSAYKGSSLDMWKVVVAPEFWNSMMDVFDEMAFYEPQAPCSTSMIRYSLLGKRCVLHADEHAVPYLLVSTVLEQLTCPCDPIQAAVPIAGGFQEDITQL